MRILVRIAVVAMTPFLALAQADAQIEFRPAEPIEIKGRAVVSGPDILLIDNRPLLLYGIDAPERRQGCSASGRPWDCGTAASKTLIDLVGDYEVTCIRRNIDNFSRPIAKCTVNGKDVAAEMVKAGMAMAYRKESTDYVALEEEAKQKKVGIWRGTVMPPWDFREMLTGHPQAR